MRWQQQGCGTVAEELQHDSQQVPVVVPMIGEAAEAPKTIRVRRGSGQSSKPHRRGPASSFRTEIDSL